jgi:hypothetical protein
MKVTGRMKEKLMKISIMRIAHSTHPFPSIEIFYQIKIQSIAVMIIKNVSLIIARIITRMDLNGQNTT